MAPLSASKVSLHEHFKLGSLVSFEWKRGTHDMGTLVFRMVYIHKDAFCLVEEPCALEEGSDVQTFDCPYSGDGVLHVTTIGAGRVQNGDALTLDRVEQSSPDLIPPLVTQWAINRMFS